MSAAVTCSSPLLWISDSVSSAINLQLLTSDELNRDKNARTSALAQNPDLVFIPGSGGSGNAWALKGEWWIAAYSECTVLCSPLKTCIYFLLVKGARPKSQESKVAYPQQQIQPGTREMESFHMPWWVVQYSLLTIPSTCQAHCPQHKNCLWRQAYIWMKTTLRGTCHF